MKQKLNKFRTFIRTNEAVITVVLGILLIPIALGILCMLLVAPFAFDEVGIFISGEVDISNPLYLVAFFGSAGWIYVSYILMTYVFDFASAIVSVIRGKKTRIKTEE